MNSQTMIFPEYIKEFECIGHDCTDNCCIGWRVDIDKATYQGYRNYAESSGGNEELQELLYKRVTRNRSVKSDVRYAKVKMNLNMRCPFLNEHNLCDIQREMGMEALSTVCMTYPRKYAKINNAVEMNVTLSCPEAARLALLKPEGISFVSEPAAAYSKIKYGLDREFNVKQQYAFTVKYYYDIQSSAIAILQYRPLTIEQRLMVLGVFSKKLFDLFAEAKGNIEKIINDFSNPEYVSFCAERLAGFQKEYMAQLILLREMSLDTLRSTGRGASDRNVEHVALATAAIFVKSKTDAEIVNDYRDTGIPKYKEYIKEKSYIFENYLVNTLYEQFYPLNDAPPEKGGNDIFLGYMRLFIKFVILRTTFIGLLMNGQDANDDFIVAFIQAYAKGIHHSQVAINGLLDKMRAEGNYTVAGASILLNI